jgi:hypothetical protein
MRYRFHCRQEPSGSSSTYHDYARAVAKKAAIAYIKKHKKEIEAAGHSQ